MCMIWYSYLKVKKKILKVLYEKKNQIVSLKIKKMMVKFMCLMWGLNL